MNSKVNRYFKGNAAFGMLARQARNDPERSTYEGAMNRRIAIKAVAVAFVAIDQAKLASGAGIELRPSTLLVFGNPPLGIQFLTAKPAAGLDWPVRLLVTEDALGQVFAMYTDFSWIARRHGIESRGAAFK